MTPKEAKDQERTTLGHVLFAAHDRRNALRARLGGLAAPLHPKLTLLYEAILDWDLDNADRIMAVFESLSPYQIAAVNAEVRL